MSSLGQSQGFLSSQRLRLHEVLPLFPTMSSLCAKRKSYSQKSTLSAPVSPASPFLHPGTKHTKENDKYYSIPEGASAGYSLAHCAGYAGGRGGGLQNLFSIFSDSPEMPSPVFHGYSEEGRSRTVSAPATNLNYAVLFKYSNSENK